MENKLSKRISVNPALRLGNARQSFAVPGEKLRGKFKFASPKVSSITMSFEANQQPKRNFFSKQYLRIFNLGIASLIGILFSISALHAFEAHVINVTAKIMPRPCLIFNVYSQGYWKNHTDEWLLPQNLGPLEINTVEEGLEIFDTKKTHLDKLRVQLLALKLSLASEEGAGQALVPGLVITLQQLADQVDALLSQDPLPSDTVLEDLKDLVESVNVAHTVSTCEGHEPGSGGDDDDDDEGNGNGNGNNNNDNGQNNENNSSQPALEVVEGEVLSEVQGTSTTTSDTAATSTQTTTNSEQKEKSNEKSEENSSNSQTTSSAPAQTSSLVPKEPKSSDTESQAAEGEGQ